MFQRLFAAIRYFSFHPDPVKRLLISLTYVGLGLVGNFYLFQAFCHPVSWAAAWLAVFVSVILLMPWLNKGAVVRSVAALVCGSGIPVCIYCIVFLATPFPMGSWIVYLFGIFIGGIGLLVGLPLYILYHVHRYYRALSGRHLRVLFRTGCLIPVAVFVTCIPGFLLADRQLRAASVKPFSHPDWQAVPRDYYSERLTGAGFKYHTRLCFFFDGWRPPLHDPMLNMYLWLFHRQSPRWPVNRTLVYRYLFPDKPVWVDCSCSDRRDSRQYFLHDTTYIQAHFEKDPRYDF